MTHLKSLITKEDSSDKEYKVDDIDNPNGWNWKELDWLFNMGFSPEGETRLTYSHDKNNKYDLTKKPLEIKIYKNKQGYWLIMNNRKHVFRTFVDMMNHIDEFGSVEV
jgi:hypothetical protein